MPKFQNVTLGEIIPRIIADCVAVHLCMIIALVSSVFFELRAGGATDPQQLLYQLSGYYLVPFTALSFLFPLVFLMHGFYTKSRSYMSKYKRLVVLQGAVTAVLIFLAANYLFFRMMLPARSVFAIFCVSVPVATIGIRELKNALSQHFVSAPSSVEIKEGKEQILVIGGAGYIGSILARDLLNAGYSVRIFDNLLYGYRAIESILFHPRLQMVVGDCRNIQSAVKAVQGCHSIVHLAAIVGDPACEIERRTALETNYAATRMLIEIAKGNGVERFVFASSCSVYGASELFCDERAETRPISLYAETKINSERVLLESLSESFHPTVLRFATIFGTSYRPRFDLVVNLLVGKAMSEHVITIYNGQQWRPFLHVGDAARAILMTLCAPVPVVSGQIFNVGDSRLNYTLDQLAELICKEFPNLQVERVDNQDRRNYRVSFGKIKNRLGFECTKTLEDGIRELKEALQERPQLDYKDVLYSNLRFIQSFGTPPPQNDVDGRIMAAFVKQGDAQEPEGERAAA